MTVPARDAADTALSLLTRHQLDNYPDWAHLHGGALTDDRGAAVVILGPSGAGKSTLVANLAAAGLTLITDEQVSLHPDAGLIAGFTRPLAVKPGGALLIPGAAGDRLTGSDRTELVTAAELGAARRLAARPVLVVLPERGDDMEPHWVQLAGGDAVQAFAANNLDLTRAPANALESYGWLAATVPVVAIGYGHVDDAVPMVLELLADPPTVDPVDWRVRQHVVRDATSGPSWNPRSPDDVGTADTPSPSGDDPSSGGADPDSPLACTLSVAPVPGLLELTVGDSTVLFDPTSRRVAQLNHEAAEVWETLPWVDRDVRQAELEAQLGLLADLADLAMVELGGAVTVPRTRCQDLVHRCMGDEVLVVDPANRIARLGGSAAVVWNLMDQPRSPVRVAQLVHQASLDSAVSDCPSKPNWGHHLSSVSDTINQLIQAQMLT